MFDRNKILPKKQASISCFPHNQSKLSSQVIILTSQNIVHCASTGNLANLRKTKGADEAVETIQLLRQLQFKRCKQLHAVPSHSALVSGTLCT